MNTRIVAAFPFAFLLPLVACSAAPGDGSPAASSASAITPDQIGAPGYPCSENGDGTCTCTGSGVDCCSPYPGQEWLKSVGCTDVSSTEGPAPSGPHTYQCTCVVPPMSDVLHPAYQLIDILYAMPGNKSQAAVSAGRMFGTQTQVSVNNKVTDIVQAGTNVASVKETWSLSTTSGSALDVRETEGSGFTVQNTADAFTHLDDVFVLWLNPRMKLTSSSGTLPPFTTTFDVDDGATMEVTTVTLAQLINPKLVPNYLHLGTLLANLTPADRSAIIALDPWGAFYEQSENFPCGGDVACEAQHGQIHYRCPNGVCGANLGGIGHLLGGLLPGAPANSGGTSTLHPVGGNVGGLLGSILGKVTVVSNGPGEPPPMYLDKLDSNRFENKGVVQILGPQQPGEQDVCSGQWYAEATTSAASLGVTDAASMQVLAGGKFDLGVDVSVMAGFEYSYSYTNTTISETGESIQENLATCSSTPYFHQCARVYFDKAIGTFILDNDGPGSTNPNDGMNCGE